MRATTRNCQHALSNKMRHDISSRFGLKLSHWQVWADESFEHRGVLLARTGLRAYHRARRRVGRVAALAFLLGLPSYAQSFAIPFRLQRKSPRANGGNQRAAANPRSAAKPDSRDREQARRSSSWRRTRGHSLTNGGSACWAGAMARTSAARTMMRYCCKTSARTMRANIVSCSPIPPAASPARPRC